MSQFCYCQVEKSNMAVEKIGELYEEFSWRDELAS